MKDPNIFYALIKEILQGIVFALILIIPSAIGTDGPIFNGFRFIMLVISFILLKRTSPYKHKE